MSPVARRYLVALATLLITAGVLEGIRAISAASPAYTPNFETLPLRIADYEGESIEVDQSIFNFLGADAMLERLYTGPEGTVSATLIYGAHWRNVHSPAGCYPAQGWLIVNSETVEVPAPHNSPTPENIQAQLIRVSKEDQQRLAMFVFCHPGGTTSDWTWQTVNVLFGQIFSQRGAGGVIIILRTDPMPNLAVAQRRLEQFLAEVYPYAVGFWYEDSAKE